MASKTVSEVTVRVKGRSDVEQARREARSLAAGASFSSEDTERIVLAVSELATNLVMHAEGGHIRIRTYQEPLRSIVEIESGDEGPGIDGLDQAMIDGYSTGGGLGSGLPA